MTGEVAPIQAIAIVASLIFLALIVNLVRKRRLAEEYSLLWLLVGIAFVAISIFRGLIEQIARLLGIFYAPSAIFLMAIFFIVWLLLRFSLIVSDLAAKSRVLAQEIALLKLQREEGPVAERPGEEDAP